MGAFDGSLTTYVLGATSWEVEQSMTLHEPVLAIAETYIGGTGLAELAVTHVSCVARLVLDAASQEAALAACRDALRAKLAF